MNEELEAKCFITIAGRVSRKYYEEKFYAWYKKIELNCREGVKAQLERMKSLCKERDSLYEKQNDLRGQKQKIERALEQ